MRTGYTRRQILTTLSGMLLLAGCSEGNRGTLSVMSEGGRIAGASATASPITTVATTSGYGSRTQPQLPASLGASFSGSTLGTGLTAPSFALPDTTGKMIALSSLQGHAVMLSFVATTCAPCAAELPLLATTQRQYGSTVHIVLIGVMAAASDLEKFTAANGGAALLALADHQGIVSRAYHISLVPTTVFLNGDGRIVASQRGELTPATLTADLAKAGAARGRQAVSTLPPPTVPVGDSTGCCAPPAGG